MDAGMNAIQASTDSVCPNVVETIMLEHEVMVYTAANGNYVKEVIRNVEHDIGDAMLARLVVHQGNPRVCRIKHIKKPGSVIFLFDGGDVPSYIRVGRSGAIQEAGRGQAAGIIFKWLAGAFHHRRWIRASCHCEMSLQNNSEEPFRAHAGPSTQQRDQMGTEMVLMGGSAQLLVKFVRSTNYGRSTLQQNTKDISFFYFFKRSPKRVAHISRGQLGSHAIIIVSA
ncbi:hypothetical protein HPB51_003953 [Rhipicephalus microplus]|uniref:Uncharacterized protein n=1 Tax=Rhipicephalus microplus TaxID=6941 RepID=A0A9J6EXD9_RHIMP|nr:hypothetical protein HPB51_003953 [Rhipicephalus microplus]